jgi:hypothetical protein
MFMSHASHTRKLSYKGGRGPMFTYVEATICSCKGVKRSSLMITANVVEGEQKIVGCKR